MKNYQKHISYISQKNYILNSSIKNNIAFGVASDEIDDKLMEEVIKMSGLESLIESNDDGIDFIVGDRGNKLSGGQVQRIGIARALYNRPSVLILDEATSSLDSESEKLIQTALVELQKNRTTIVIAHRLSTIENADKIIVLDSGKIIESGKHSELILKKGLYAKLHKIQFPE